MRPYLDNSAVRVYLNTVDDSQPEQYVGVKGLPDETWAQVLRVQPFGLSSTPPQGSHGIGLALGGRREQMFALGVEDPKSRPTNLPQGSTALYDSSGNIMKLIGKQVDFSFVGHPWTVVSKGVTITSDGDDILVQISDNSKKVKLGMKGGPWFSVITTAGPSKHVLATL